MPTPPIDLFSSPVHLRPDGGIQTAHAAMAAGAELDGWLLAVMHAESEADVHSDLWELHPDADEFVSCITAEIRIVFRPERSGDTDEEIRLTPGTAAIVPRGRWHRLIVDTPGYMMAVTLPRGTVEEPASAQVY
ncbi:cupin [Streptodolium elevatio]